MAENAIGLPVSHEPDRVQNPEGARIDLVLINTEGRRAIPAWLLLRLSRESAVGRATAGCAEGESTTRVLEGTPMKLIKSRL